LTGAAFWFRAVSSHCSGPGKLALSFEGRPVDNELLRVLAAADDPTHTEYPPDFDWQEAMKKVRDIRPALEHIAGRALEFDDQVQDATYFAAFSITGPIEGKPNYRREAFAIYFSSFGHLVAVWNDGILSTRALDKIIGKMKDHGFVVVNANQLEEPYTGCHPGFASGRWLDRFFNYT
jgi:hypothetical protein